MVIDIQNKEEVVKYYDDHPELEYLSLARIFDIPSDESVRRWVKEKQARGDDAFNPKPRMNSNKGKIKRNAGISSDYWEESKEANESIAFFRGGECLFKKANKELS